MATAWTTGAAVLATVCVTGAAAFVTVVTGLLGADAAGAAGFAGAGVAGAGAGAAGAAVAGAAAAGAAAAGAAGAAAAGAAGAAAAGAAGAAAAGAGAAGAAGAAAWVTGAATLATVWVTGAATFATGGVTVETAWPRSSPEAALAVPSPTSSTAASSRAKPAIHIALLVPLLKTPLKTGIRRPLPTCRERLNLVKPRPVIESTPPRWPRLRRKNRRFARGTPPEQPSGPNTWIVRKRHPQRHSGDAPVTSSKCRWEACASPS